MTTSERTYQSRFTSAMRRHNTTGRLTPAEVERLRSLIPCVVCRTPMGQKHLERCPVPRNREGGHP